MHVAEMYAPKAKSQSATMLDEAPAENGATMKEADTLVGSLKVERAHGKSP